MQRSKLFKWSTVIIICIFARLILLWIPQKNNVCSTLSAYFTINNNDNCWHNSDKGLSAVQIISKYGYKFEEHIVTSEDGYRLFVYRILPKGNSSFNQPLLLMPGMGGSPEFWLLQGAKSIIFLLANNGYDVWLSAVRGTVDYDEELKNFKNEEEYWNFSFHEIGIYDLPALTDYITKQTKSKVIFVGHSMGSTASYVYAIEKKTHAENNLKGLVSLAPAAYMEHTQGFFKFIGPKNEWIWDFTKKIGCYAVSNTYTKRLISSLLCAQYPGVYGCYYFYGYMSGLSPTEERPDMVPLFFSVMPSPISMRILAHFGQLIETTRFQKFDYRDDQINLEKYGSLKPPDYNISQISLPIQLFTGTYDFSSSDKDFCGGWTLKTRDINKLEAFEMWLYRRILKIPWTAKITNIDVLKRIIQERQLFETIKKRKTAYLGHIIRNGQYQFLQLIIEGKRGIGRKKMSWLRNIRQWTGINDIKSLIHIARNRELMKNVIANIH
ncbi:unnamed protein product [Diabrotica balteata]|uniref:Partial AB-hydrolase lipase domain-containing protein n=1 Tax=Diabrotica balteata TaxID=107213 RepID=A0A9N9XIC6_DIABA|nr:unnamed protein product [Diabrotica balteata]